MVICTLSLWTVMNCATSFFLFVVEKLQIKPLESGVGKWLRQLPAMFSTIMIATNPWTHLVFRLNEDGYFIHEAMYLPTLVVASLYLLSVAVMSLVNIFRKQTRFLRGLPGCFPTGHSFFLRRNISVFIRNCLRGYIPMPERSGITTLRKRNGCWKVTRFPMAVH